MKIEEYYVLTNKTDSNFKPIFQGTFGEPIKIKGYEKYDFFIHKVGKDEYSKYYRYALSEGRTGLRIGSPGQTKRETIENALKTLDRLPKKEIDRVIKYYISEYGLSSKYR